MTPISRDTLSEKVVEQIMQLIQEKFYRPGDRLPGEREIAEQLGVGRTSVREGLQYLGKMGVLDIRQGRGMLVRSVSLNDVFKSAAPISHLVDLPEKEIQDIMYIRRVLELESAALAAQNRKERHLQKLRVLLEDMRKSIDRPSEFLTLDLTFHIAIAEASGNVAMEPLVRLLRDLYAKHSEVIVRDLALTTSSFRYHEQLLDAILQSDADAAKLTMLNHLREGERAVLRALEGGGQV